jgi:hypothetical protein
LHKYHTHTQTTVIPLSKAFFSASLPSYRVASAIFNITTTMALLHLSKLILLLCLLFHAANAFSNAGFSSNSHLEKYIRSNALRTSRRNGVPSKTPIPTFSSTAINVFSSESRSGEASKEALITVLWDRLAQGLVPWIEKFTLSFPAWTVALSSLSENLSMSVRKYWWLSPMVLAIIPVYHAVVNGVCVAMPEWWSVVEMHHIAASDSAPWVIGHFLGSNISYFMSGCFLMLKRFPLLRWRTKGRGIKIRVTKFSLLGAWICLAGLVSTIFHSVQALGSYPLAQSLCYVDHAVAFSSFCYFLDTCGFPSKRVLSIGSASLVTLAVTSPGYTFLHSTWHYLSAATATLWALEGYGRLFDSESSAA